MVEEEKLLKGFINKFEAKVQLKDEHDLIKNYYTIPMRYVFL